MRGARGGTDPHLGWHRMWITFESCMSCVFSLSSKSISGEPGSTGCPPILMKEVVSAGPFLCARQGAGCWNPSGEQDPVPVLGELTGAGREMNTQQLWRQLIALTVSLPLRCRQVIKCEIVGKVGKKRPVRTREAPEDFPTQPNTIISSLRPPREPSSAEDSNNLRPKDREATGPAGAPEQQGRGPQGAASSASQLAPCTHAVLSSRGSPTLRSRGTTAYCPPTSQHRSRAA